MAAMPRRAKPIAWEAPGIVTMLDFDPGLVEQVQVNSSSR
jgi:hypothetical protein